LKRELPEPWSSIYLERREAITARLNDFAQVTPEQYFYELIFCILTPQSSQRNAERVIEKLQRDDFYENGFDPTSYLRDPEHYIRFHNVKSKRLLVIREKYSDIHTLLRSDIEESAQLRDRIVELVPGFGLKEGAHFLRNIGYRDLAILDRHIFKHLISLGIIKKLPKSLTKKRYFSIEKKWKKFADEVGISIDELDLLFWSMEVGEIKK
jgi:N-glycosylase/DNA lyase